MSTKTQRPVTQEDRYQKISHLECQYLHSYSMEVIVCRNYFVPVIHFEGESYRFILLADGSPKSYRIHDPKLTMFKPGWWMDLFGHKGSPSHTCHTSMDAGVNWVRDQWRDVKYLGCGKMTEGMDQNGRTEHVQLHANQSNHLGCRSKKSAKKVGFQKGLQEGFRDVRSRIQLSELNHREDIDWKSRWLFPPLNLIISWSLSHKVVLCQQDSHMLIIFPPRENSSVQRLIC